MLSCSSGDPLTAPEPVTIMPAQFPPTEPGYLVIGPEGLVLRPGETVPLTAALLLASQMAPAQVVEWKSETPEVVTIAATGALTAVAPGPGEIVARDAAGRERLLEVQVSTMPPSGPTAAAFAVPALELMVGQEQTVTIALTDAGGRGVSNPPDIELRAEGASGGLTLVPAPGGVTVRATGAGSFWVRAYQKGQSEPLGGAMQVMVLPGSATASGVSGGCPGGEWKVVGCWQPSRPLLFSTPGLAHKLRLEVVEQLHCPGGGGPLFERRRFQAAPSDVTIGHPGVLEVGGDGLLRAKAPGVTAYGTSYKGTICDCETTRVLQDPNGRWSLSCRNGDQGAVCVSGWPKKVITRSAPAFAPSHSSLNYYAAKGTSSVSNEKQNYQCEGQATVLPGIYNWGDRCSASGSPQKWRPTGQLCSDNGCQGGGASHCAYSRHMASGGLLSDVTVRGADRFDQLDCSYTRGAGSCQAAPAGFSCEPYTMGSTAPYGACPGTFLQSFCSRYGRTACPTTFAASFAAVAAGPGCVCANKEKLTPCCDKARAAIAGRSWKTRTPTLKVWQEEVPYWCSVACLFLDPSDTAACNAIASELRTCNAAVCSLDAFDGYQTACEKERCDKTPSASGCP